MNHAIVRAKTVDQIIGIEAQLESVEMLMRKSGMYALDKLRPINEARMTARWKLGQILSRLSRNKQGRPSKTGKGVTHFAEVKAKYKLTNPIIIQAERLGTLPEPDLHHAFAVAETQDVLSTFEGLVRLARSYWYEANRKERHQDIADKAATVAKLPDDFGPFPLILADPPWTFDVYSDKGLERTPTQKYPTLTDDQIKDFCIGGKRIEEIAHIQIAHAKLMSVLVIILIGSDLRSMAMRTDPIKIHHLAQSDLL